MKSLMRKKKSENNSKSNYQLMPIMKNANLINIEREIRNKIATIGTSKSSATPLSLRKIEQFQPTKTSKAYSPSSTQTRPSTPIRLHPRVNTANKESLEQHKLCINTVKKLKWSIPVFFNQRLKKLRTGQTPQSTVKGSRWHTAQRRRPQWTPTKFRHPESVPLFVKPKRFQTVKRERAGSRSNEGLDYRYASPLETQTKLNTQRFTSVQYSDRYVKDNHEKGIFEKPGIKYDYNNKEMILFELMPWSQEGYIDPGIYTSTYDSSTKDIPGKLKEAQVS